MGTAGVLGLKPVAQRDLPTTAYLLTGERCLRDCGFCPQARSASSRADLLSRITWPLFSLEEVLARLEGSGIRRVCVQVVEAGKSAEQRRQLVELTETLARTGLPVCVSCFLPAPERISALLAAGADGVTLPLDAASEEAYRRSKGGSLRRALARLEQAAREFPGRIGTHLIVGLGETEEEITRLLQLLADWGVRVGLFAFTPVPGTALARLSPPPLATYRRVQAAHYLIRCGLARAEEFSFREGKLVGFGPRFPPGRLTLALADGEAFRTTGCRDCNRPYYNERPGEIPYNYPRPLTAEEASAEGERLLASLGGEETRCAGA